MKLSIPYLYNRHQYWKFRIHDAGIWDALKFKPVEIVMRNSHKRYNALFQHRTKVVGGSQVVSDKIIVYNKSLEFDPSFLDNILVHEMIHQFTLQNNIKDSSPHGRVFKHFMNQINSKFPDELKIRVKDQNPAIPRSGAGDTVHTLLLLHLKDGSVICSVINPRKISEFEKIVKKNKKFWNIRKHQWAVSNDVYFNQFSRCTKRLRGVRKEKKENPEFMARYNITLVPNPR